MNWNWEYFSQIGYLSVALWAAAILLCLLYLLKPARLVSTLALGLAVAAFVTAKINSESYVNRIQIDRSAEVAKRKALEEAKRQAALDARGDEVAQIRFAEDGAGDFLDRAGMDEADLKYYERLEKGESPDWKKEKKERSGGGDSDDSLESVIGGEEVIEGVESESIEEKNANVEPSAVMLESEVVMANRLDTLNLQITFYLIFIVAFVVTVDYLRRANLYGKSSFPLPLPSSWLNALNPISPLIVSKKKCRKSATAELARLAKRGDSFLYLTDDSERASKLPDSMRRFPLVGGQEDLIPVTEEVDDEFVFEAIWYGRSSFIVGSPERAQQIFRFFLEKLDERKVARARVSQTAHIVWDLEVSMPPQMRREAERLAEATGFSVLLLREKRGGIRETLEDSQPMSERELLTS